MNGRSVETLRRQMAAAGYPIGSGTIHRALKGETGNRLESLEKLAAFFDRTVEQLLQPDGLEAPVWPFSAELQQEVLRLGPDELVDMETSMWAFLRKPKPETLQFSEHQGSRVAPPRPATVTVNAPGVDFVVGKVRHAPKR